MSSHECRACPLARDTLPPVIAIDGVIVDDVVSDIGIHRLVYVPLRI
jgi:hypothetical protein